MIKYNGLSVIFFTLRKKKKCCIISITSLQSLFSSLTKIIKYYSIRPVSLVDKYISTLDAIKNIFLIVNIIINSNSFIYKTLRSSFLRRYRLLNYYAREQKIYILSSRKSEERHQKVLFIIIRKGVYSLGST